MKILIIGSEGFIGSNAVKYFTSRAYEVYKADIVIKEEPGYTIINPEHTDFASLFSGIKPDACLNATGSANVQFSFTNPVLDYSLNVVNVYHLLDAIRKYSPGCRFINISSAAVYGNPKELPISEDASVSPLSPYGLHKLYSEQVCAEFHQYFKVPTKSIRIFSAYGKGQNKMLFYDLFKKLISSENGTVNMFGSGNESRDFIHITDIVRAIEVIIETGEFDGKAINVASGVEYTIREAAEMFVASFSKQYKIQFTGKEKVGDPQNWCADISRLRSLGFETSISLNEGVNEYVEWIKNSGAA